MRRKGPILRCGATLRPRQGAAGQGAPHPHCLPHLQQPDELMHSARGKAWYRSLSLAASQAFHCQGHREHRLRDSKGPKVFPNHWKQAVARPRPRTQQHPQSRSYKWKCILRGAEHGPEGGWVCVSEVTHHRIKIQTAFTCGEAGAIPGIGFSWLWLPARARPPADLKVFLSITGEYWGEGQPCQDTSGRYPLQGGAQMSFDVLPHLPMGFRFILCHDTTVRSQG